MKPIFAQSTKKCLFLPHVSIFIMTQFPNSDFGLIWLKSFLFTSRMEREREKMDVNWYLKKYSRNKICYYCYCKTKIGCVVSLPIVPVIVVKIANLVLRIFRQISIDVHFFSFFSHSTSKKETFEPFWTKIPIGELCQNQDPSKALKNQFLSHTFQQRMVSGILQCGEGTPIWYLRKYPKIALSLYPK